MRRDFMRIKLIIIVFILLFFLIIILQNTQPVILSLLFWQISLPFIIMVMVLFIIGFAMGAITSSLLSQKKTNNKKGQ